jgi:hypothetical protein
MLPTSTLLAGIDRADRHHWLTNCEGFHVRSGSRRLGVVGFVRRELDPRLPDTIHVCAGIMRLREIAVPVDAVEALDPRRQTIWVRMPEYSRAWRSRRLADWLQRVGGRTRTVQRATPGSAQ